MPSINLSNNADYKRCVLIVICLASGLVPFMGSSVNLSLPQIATDYEMNSIMQSWIITVHLITSAIFQIPFGRLADIVGRKRIFVHGLLLLGISSIACALPYGGIYLIVCRAIQGIGSAMTFSTGMAILTTTFEPHERGKAMGINVAVVYLSLALGPSLGGFLTHLWGWESIFIITAVLSFTGYIGSMLVIKDFRPEAQGEPFDSLGALFYGLALILLIYGFTILPSITGFILIGVGIALFCIFIIYENRIKYPVFNARLFYTNRQFTLSSIAALLNYAVSMPVGFFMSLYLQIVKGLEVQTAGIILITQALVQALLSPVAGKLSDKIQPHYLASMGMGLISVALLCIGLFIQANSSILLVVFIFILLGIGFALFSSPNTNAIMGSVDKRDYSTASATTGTMRLTGQAFGMGVATMILSLFVGNQSINPLTANQFMTAMRITFIVFSVLSVIGIYASMARNKNK